MVSFLCVAKSNAQFVTILNPQFVSCINLSYPGCMNLNILDNTCSDVLNAINVDCSNYTIYDLNGIFYFKKFKNTEL